MIRGLKIKGKGHGTGTCKRQPDFHERKGAFEHKIRKGQRTQKPRPAVKKDMVEKKVIVLAMVKGKKKNIKITGN